MSNVNKNTISVFECIEKAIASHEKFIYLKRNMNIFEVLPLNNLYGVICDLGDSSVYQYGVPPELIARVDMSLGTPKTIYVNNQSIAYYSPDGYDSKENVLNIIKIFNSLSSRNITIYTTEEIYKYVNNFSNSNIVFSCYKDPNEITISASVIISFGYCMRAFVEQKMPTIVIGPNGMGGWVTPENLSYLFRENFLGRPKGTYNELIPLSLFVDELMEIEEHTDMASLLQNNADLLENYLDKSTISKRDTSINDFQNTYIKITDTRQRLSLRPSLPSNVDLRKNGDTVIIQRRILNDLLFSLPESDADFLDDLKNNLSCKELQEKYELNADEFWDIIMPLWERKAIVFMP